MGDRANFGLKQTDGNIIFIYGHWAGHNMLAKFANAIDRAVDAGRIGDYAYTNRIIISDLIGEDWIQDMRWGITVNTLADNEHKIPVFDLANDTVTLYDWDWNSGLDAGLGDSIVTFTRQDFVSKYSKTLAEV